MQTVTKKPKYSSFPSDLQKHLNMPLSDRLREVRLARNLGIRKVIADLKERGISIGYTSLQGYECKEGSMNHRYPSLPVLMALAKYYDVSLDYLFGLTETESYKPQPKKKPRKKKALKSELYLDISLLLNSGEELKFDGEPLSPDQLELIKSSVELALVRF